MNFQTLEKENITTAQLILLMLFAYLFSVVMRMIWVYQFADMQSFYWNAQLMINTNDGYYFASGVQKALDGLHQYNPRIPDWLGNGVVFLTTLLTKYTPLTLNTVILYLPAFISSLVVIPIILIGRLYRLSILGFFAALIGSIAWSYYNRTMTGYYDTDMFSAMAPMFILYFLMHAIEDQNLKSALYAAIAIAIYPFLYDQGLSIVYAMGIIYFIYMAVYHKNHIETYQSIILVCVSLLPFKILISVPYNFLFKIIVLIGIYVILKRVVLPLKVWIITAVAIVLLFLTFGNVFGLILAKVAGYTLRGTEGSGLHFFGVSQTVREAGRIPFEVMANRISGSIPALIAGIIGYILLVIRYRPFILALPLIGIGVFSLWGGLRFTVYAVPVAAISIVYLFYIVANFAEKKFVKYLLIASLTLLTLYPNIKHIVKYKVPTVFNSEEVKVLDKLNQIASSKDYTVTWWDYGYPIWYYSDTNTLIDGGKHNEDNFIVSKILTTDSQIQAVNLSRLAVETYIASGYKVVANTIFKNNQKDQINPNKLLNQMKNDDFKLPKKTRDIYLFLPQRMLNIFPTVAIFSNIDLMTGEQKRRSFFYMTDRFAQQGNLLNLDNGIILDKTTSILSLGDKKIPLKRFVVVAYDDKGKFVKNVQNIDKNAPLSIVFMQSYNKFLVLDEKMYNSLFIKLFVLQEYDPSLFEPAVMTPYAKVYKLKK